MTKNALLLFVIFVILLFHNSQTKLTQNTDKFVYVDVDTMIVLRDISQPKLECFNVITTIYHAVEGQTDSTPHILADGTTIDISKAGSYRYCALSRDLLKRWGGPFDYGDIVVLLNAGSLSGKWTVRDTMNSRFTNRIDLLVDAHIDNIRYFDSLIARLDDCSGI
jgi:3D (Asp-Asp-Asp) domain-containing protein